ncbi:MAG: type III polyketide synthase [Nitrospirota bacterium]
MSSRQARAHLVSVGTAVPPLRLSQEEAGRFLMEHFGRSLSERSRAVLTKVFSHPGIASRTFALESPEELLRESPDERVARFTRWAVRLSAEAALEAMEGAGLKAADISALVVNTCTGYLCPGVSTYVMERLGLSPGIRALDLVGSGCGGAVPNLDVAASLLAGGDAVLSVAVEICSATFQMADDLSLIVSNALFGDGAAAVVLQDRPEGLALMGAGRRFAPSHREAIRYVHRNGNLHNQLSTAIPRLVAGEMRHVVGELLAPHALCTKDVAHWALHTGGEKVISTLRDALGLSEAQAAPTRQVMRRYGNMSSPTALFVLKDLMERIEPGQWCALGAFGAGLSVHALLLRKTPAPGETASPGP